MAPNMSRARARAGRRGHSGRVSKSGVATHISNKPNLASEAVLLKRGGRRGRISRRGTTRGRPNNPSRVTLDSDMEASDITLLSSESESEPMSLDDGSSLSGFITDGNISTCYDDVESISDNDKDSHEPVRSDYGSGSNDSHKENLPWVSAVKENKKRTKDVVPQLQQNKQQMEQNTEQDVQKIQQGRDKTEEISLERKQEVLGVEELMDVVRAEVPAMSSDLLSHLEGILKRTDADYLLAKMVRTVATFTMRQQPITKYFPKINQDSNNAKENRINEENNVESIEDKIDDATTTAIPNTSVTSCFFDRSLNVQDRPSWDVASTSRQDCMIQEISEDSDSSTSTRFPTPTEDDDDLDSLFPPITIPQKLTPSIRMNTSLDSYRSRGKCGRRGGASRPWKGRGRGRRGWGEEDEESKPDMFSTSLADILSAGGTPHRLDIEERAPKRAGPLQVANVGEEEEMGVAETYADYVPARLTYGRPHPDRVVETASLSSVDSIEIQYQLSVPQATIEEGLLSALQLEAVVYASQAHQNVLPDGTRAGFLIGDGAGVGKGRTVAGIIFENYLKGRKRHIWVSVSNDLKYDAERDLKDIGAGNKIPVYALNKMTYNAISSVSNGHVSEGVVFSTYSSLIGYTTAASTNFKKRLQQLIDWCGPEFDGCDQIVFDECHRAKNLCPGGSTDSSKTGVAVFKLQESLPLARVVYASATGASEPRNMAYMVRLGLWGQGTPFHTFKDFLHAVEKRGVGAMEIVAMDMKLRGMYIARQLSFHGVSFKIEEVPLSAAFRDTYDKAVDLWVSAKKVFEVSVDLVNASRKWRKVMWAQFWGAHQRFFKYLCIAAKVGRTVECAKQAVAEGKCVVVGLQSTGEARTLDQLERDRGKLTQFICTAKGVFNSLVEKQFPCPDNMTEPEDYENGFPSPSVTKETNDMCTKLLQDIASLGQHLPPNTLDQLLDELGGTDNVAEMTGRKGRVVQNDKGKIVYESRTEADVPLETLNLTEKQRFMDGDKGIAIISEAASSGISLQSDRRAKNQKRRVHITLELPWSADRAIQQFGRTHRSNQVNAPEYIFLISDLAGERRFASTVAKRLESLGALTHGDRRATETRDLSQFNIENKHGRQALRRMMRGLYGSEPALVAPPTSYPGDFLTDAPAAMRDVGLEMGPDDTSTNIARFLNRLLGVKVKLQNALFQYFSDTFDAVVQEAKRSGRFDMGILDLGATGQAVRVVSRCRYLRAHATGTAPVELHTLHLERGFEWDRAVRKYQEHRNERADPDEGFYMSRTKAVGRDNAILCLAHPATRELTGRNRLFHIYRPNMGLSLRPELLNELLNKYMKSSPERCERAWRDHYQQSLTTCTHAWWLSHCSNIGCEVGVRTRTYYVLSGSVLAVWARVEAVYSELHLLNQMQVVRIKTDRGLKIVGMVIPKYCVDLLKQQLRSGAVSVEEDCTT